MFKKINSFFRPGFRSRSMTDLYTDDKDCAVRLIRTTSMFAVSQNQQKDSAILKRSKSTVSIESSAFYNYREEDRAWMYSRTQDCLQYLQELIALRKKYLNSVNNLKSGGKKSEQSTVSVQSSKSGQKPPPPPPPKLSSKPNSEVLATLAYFDSVIADIDADKRPRSYTTENKHIDVDFDVATSSSEHSLHSNWILRSPRKLSVDSGQTSKTESKFRRNSEGVTMSCKKRLQRNPIYLPKAAESAFYTLKFKPKAQKK
uniref:Chromosome 13 open reading frame 42 n=1 Tax=Latimeria chalumnae TaxID=7897 RepID=H3ALR2_LATCH